MKKWHVSMSMSLNGDSAAASPIRNRVTRAFDLNGIGKVGKATASYEGETIASMAAETLAEIIRDLGTASAEAHADTDVRLDHLWIHIQARD
ncbi:MAG: hypothetical protein HYR72_22295 [Deltaproteobacteria bacterium]|nr:hypothetical protein [Deltaproteobacteria bacterium]MBI3390579.1 hypothetical protein [Deltaproteobacteria bacterium]